MHALHTRHAVALVAGQVTDAQRHVVAGCRRLGIDDELQQRPGVVRHEPAVRHQGSFVRRHACAHSSESEKFGHNRPQQFPANCLNRHYVESISCRTIEGLPRHSASSSGVCIGLTGHATVESYPGLGERPGFASSTQSKPSVFVTSSLHGFRRCMGSD